MWPKSDSPELHTQADAEALVAKLNGPPGRLKYGHMQVHWHAKHVDVAHKYVNIGQPAWHGLQKLRDRGDVHESSVVTHRSEDGRVHVQWNKGGPYTVHVGDTVTRHADEAAALRAARRKTKSKMREITYKKLGEAMNVTVFGIKGKPSHSYDKWGNSGGVEAWKKHVASIHKGAKFSDHDGKLAKNTHAHVGDKEVGSYSHYNHSSETLREEVLGGPKYVKNYVGAGVTRDGAENTWREEMSDETLREANSPHTAKIKMRYYAGKAREIKRDIETVDGNKAKSAVEHGLKQSIVGRLGGDHRKKVEHKLRRLQQAAAAAKSVRERHPSRWPANESRDDSIKHMAAALFGAVKVNRNGKKVVDVDKQRKADLGPRDPNRAEKIGSAMQRAYDATYGKKNESVEQIDEISKNLALRYIAKAAYSVRDKGYAAGAQHDRKSDHKSWKRAANIERAAEKVRGYGNERVNATEDTLDSYVTKASKEIFRSFNKKKREGERAMSINGLENPGVVGKHQKAERLAHRVWAKRTKGVKLAIKKLTREDVEQIEESKDLRKHLQQNYVGADETDRGWYDHNKKDGTHTIRRGFYYKHGRSSEDHAKSVSDELTKLGVKHKIVDHGTVDKPFRGGASLKRQSHWWAKFTTESALDEVHSKNQLKQAIEYHSNRGGSTYVGGAGTDPRHLRRLNRRVKLHRRAADVARKMLAKENVEQIDEIGYISPLRPYKKTDLKHSGFTVWNGKLAHSSSNPNMRMNRRVGVDRDVNVNMSDDEIKREMDYHDHKVNKYLRRIKGDKNEAARRMIGAKSGPGKLPENTQIDERHRSPEELKRLSDTHDKTGVAHSMASLAHLKMSSRALKLGRQKDESHHLAMHDRHERAAQRHQRVADLARQLYYRTHKPETAPETPLRTES